jgi:autotransporter-associated beta strand protein
VQLAETGGDDFSGGLAVGGGTLILDNAGGSLSGGANIAAGATLQIGGDDANGSLPSGSVTNNGVLMFNQTADATTGNAIYGNGALTKNDLNTLTLTATNAYKGVTTVAAGTLALARTGSVFASSNLIVAAGAELSAMGRTDGTLMLTNGQTLQGNGTVAGLLVAAPGATVAPGTNANFIGALAVAGNAILAGNTLMKLNFPAATNDSIHANAVTYGGALTLTNLSAVPLAAGNSFRLFYASSSSGAFAALNPATPGPALRWNTNGLAVNGTLAVVPLAQPGIAGVNLSGASLVINASNGVAGTAYHLLTSTNVALPLNQWSPVATNLTATGGSFVITAASLVGPGPAQRFYILQAQ